MQRRRVAQDAGRVPGDERGQGDAGSVAQRAGKELETQAGAQGMVREWWDVRDAQGERDSAVR